MRRYLIWLAPLAMALLTFRMGGPGASLLESPWAALAGFAAPLALAFSLDLAVRSTWKGLPLYRRHLGLFALLAGLAFLKAWPSAAPGQPRPIPFPALAASALGLALTCLPALRSRRLGCLSWRKGVDRRPDPGAPLVLVADPHWGEDLESLREAAALQPQADWLFLGDVFDVWVGIPGMATPLQRDFLDWVGQRRAEGRWVGLWVGNREFFLDPLASHFDLMGEGTGGALPEENLAWEHGDLINGWDWRYRIWNLVARSGPMWLFARLLPGPAARNLATWLHRSLRTTNRAYKLHFPREAFRAAALESRPCTFLTGHFHTFEQEGNGIALPWAHEGQFMIWKGGEVKPFPLQKHP